MAGRRVFRRTRRSDPDDQPGRDHRVRKIIRRGSSPRLPAPAREGSLGMPARRPPRGSLARRGSPSTRKGTCTSPTRTTCGCARSIRPGSSRPSPARQIAAFPSEAPDYARYDRPVWSPDGKKDSGHAELAPPERAAVPDARRRERRPWRTARGRFGGRRLSHHPHRKGKARLRLPCSGWSMAAALTGREQGPRRGRSRSPRRFG